MPNINEFYESIEEPIRNVVKLLRDNGFNTESSCGHTMEVQIQLFPDGQLESLHSLIFNYLHKNSLPLNYKIDIQIEVIDSYMYTYLNLTFKKGKVYAKKTRTKATQTGS